MPINKLVFAVLLVVFCGTGCSPAPTAEESTSRPPQFSEEIQMVLDQKRKILHREMDNPVYVDLLRSANEALTPASPESIRKMDQEWSQKSPKDTLAQTLLTSTCSEQLRTFQSANPEFAEIFITDGQGRNICLTNKTSDYYQADEAWWLNTYTSKDPYGHYGPIEFDESSSTESISLYLPFLDPSTGNKLGIIKAVVKHSHLAEGL